MDIGTIAAIAGPVIGGMMGNKASKRDAAAQNYATMMNARAYEDARPYIKDMYSGGTDALNNALGIGAYSGSTFAGMNPVAREGFDYMTQFGRDRMGNAQGFMGAGGGFGSNFGRIYDRAAGPTLDNAIGYATSSPQASSLIDAAMRDSTRQLNEQTMPGINMAASGSGNTRSSRAGVAEAIAQRSYDDRRADVGADVYKGLVDRYISSNNSDINNMMNANAGLKNTYGIGFGMGGQIGDMLTKSGNAFQTNQQGFLDAERDAFVRDRDFAMNKYGDYNTKILGRAPQSSNQAPNYNNPYTATMGGAMAGFGLGKGFADMFTKPATGFVDPNTGYYNSFNPTPTVGVSSYY
ncbi:hypothetical protein [Candidatus Puniceispirillum marinum]|uniref:Uncharacterized protein n=1 Tax=Puniceispirillum marinum (strain IMCC1322) TaxID=488538 RepID=D5BQR0_PUNMI|nr:hypothetical protein [Candidatus Puniceispirillum marinum]ADE38624.1 hypothetical protein SAR116_0381 [Candidatus Puniceispirillum marinum IMCC1322]